jgi:myo-inositol-1(or 4)-monophosphatase
MMQFTLPEGALETAVAAAKAAGSLQMQYIREGFSVDSKSTSVDMVTEADKKSEALITEAIITRFPEHDIMGEEGAARSRNSPWRWIIDPLDGTTNFVHHHPVFCVSIALAFKGEPVLGVVYVPRLDDLYTAVAGGGAFRNGAPVHVAARSHLAETLLATGVPYDRATSRENNLAYISALTPRVRGLRRLGAAAYDLCLVAEGVYDAYFELKIRPWDIAAGALIVREAGGAARHWAHEGDDRARGVLDCLASSPSILPQLLDALSVPGPAYLPAQKEPPRQL